MKLLISFSLLTLFLLLSLSNSWSQVTTSGLSGRITDAKKAVLVGATVQAVYTPTGTKYAAVTNIDGRFRINNMNAGGPYEITVSYVSYKSETRADVMLQLGETTNLHGPVYRSDSICLAGLCLL